MQVFEANFQVEVEYTTYTMGLSIGKAYGCDIPAPEMRDPRRSKATKALRQPADRQLRKVRKIISVPP